VQRGGSGEARDTGVRTVTITPVPESPESGALEAPMPARLTFRPGADTLLKRPDGAPVAARIPVGKGSVYLFSSYDYLSNAWIDRKDNFKYFYVLFSRLGGHLVFDEYHHGHRAPELSKDEKRVTALWVFQLMLLAGLYFLAQGQRFGRTRFVPERERYRSPLEHVDAVANLFQKSNVTAEILKDYYRYFRELLNDRLFVPVQAESVEAARASPAWSRIHQIESEYRALAPDRAVTASALTVFARDIEALKEALK
ncbi:MAG: hypothetical protein ACREDU_12695, partial [Methylocella sp.]